MPDSLENALPHQIFSAFRSRTLGGNNAFHNFYNDYSHISDPNMRRRLALSEIDKVPFSLYRMFSSERTQPYSASWKKELPVRVLTWVDPDVRAILVAGVGFFLDSYDIFAINLVTSLLGLVFWSGDDKDDGYGGNSGVLPNPTSQALKASTSAGIVVGMIVMGWMAE
jgi:PHS family inorganic phosphate transporter-like MFS transporter